MFEGDISQACESDTLSDFPNNYSKGNTMSLKIAKQFKAGAQSQLAAALAAKKLYRSRAKAQQALLPAFASAYSASTTTTKKGVVRWKKGAKNVDAASKALSRLLRMAFGATKKVKRSQRIDKVAMLVKRIHKLGLTAAQIKRLKAEI